MPAWAQGGPGTIRGQVTDPAGGSIPGAVVSANNGHGTSRSATTDVRGEYVLGNLSPGAYTRCAPRLRDSPSQSGRMLRWVR